MKAHNIEIGHKRMGTYWMFENNEEDWIKAFFGSREKQKAIKDWDEYDLHHPSEEVTYLDHGYDETKKLEELTLEDLKKAAQFRGGKCLVEEVPDIYTPILWECADGHQFMMSVNAVLQGGHWCPECLSHEWRYGQIAKKNPFYFFLPLELPTVLSSAVNSIASMNAPVAMIILGTYLAQMKFRELFTDKTVYLCAFMRLIVIPLATAVILMLLPGNEMLKMSVLIVAATPVGSNVAIFAQMENMDYTQAVKDICLSTILCIVTILLIVTAAGKLL